MEVDPRIGLVIAKALEDTATRLRADQADMLNHLEDGFYITIGVYPEVPIVALYMQVLPAPRLADEVAAAMDGVLSTFKQNRTLALQNKGRTRAAKRDVHQRQKRQPKGSAK